MAGPKTGAATGFLDAMSFAQSLQTPKQAVNDTYVRPLNTVPAATAGPVTPAGPTSQQRNAIAALQGLFAENGLSSLYGLIEGWVLQGYTDPAAIEMLARQTPEWKARFPAMDALAKKGRNLSVAEYLGYEKAAAQYEQMYGFAPGLVTGAVTDLLTNEVSAAELQNRLVLAAADSLTAPADLRAQIKDFYGVDTLDPDMALRSYYLDPDRAMPILEQQSAAARIGVWATRQQVQSDKAFAEEMAAQGVTEAQAQANFGVASRTQSLTDGRGDVASQSDVLHGAFGNTQSQSEVERAARARKSRFDQGGQYAGNNRGLGAIGAANT